MPLPDWLTRWRVSDGGDGVHRGVLDSTLPDSRSARSGSFSCQCSLLKEFSRVEGRRLRLSVDSLLALGRIAEDQLPPVERDLCRSFSLEASREFAADGFRAHHVYAEVAQSDVNLQIHQVPERHHRSERTSDFRRDPRR